jgi:hypothetical protein
MNHNRVKHLAFGELVLSVVVSHAATEAGDQHAVNAPNAIFDVG